MTTVHPPIPTIYSPGAFSEAEFTAELERVHAETAIDRQWLEDFAVPFYETDNDILEAFAQDKLANVARGSGFIAIDRLTQWTPERSSPMHQYHYSPPYVLKGVDVIMNRIGEKYQSELGVSRLPSLTSGIRSGQYQKGLAQRYRMLTITNPDEHSSHEGGIAFDLAGSGLFELNDKDMPVRINGNPNNGLYIPSLIEDSNSVLKLLLDEEQFDGTIHYVEELPGTQENAFHVCVNPAALSE